MKNRFYICYLLCVSTYMLSSCITEKESTSITPILASEKITTIDLDNAKNQDVILSSSILKTPTVVPLETTDKCVVQRIQNLEVFDNKIYILDDKSNRLYVFSIDGKYLYNLGHVGNGSGEYLELSDFSIDKKRKIIYLWDEAKDKILKYHLDTRKFISAVHSDRNGERSYGVQFAHDKLYINRTSKTDDTDNYMIKEVDPSTGNISDKFLDSYSYNKGWNYPLRSGSSNFCDRGSINPKFIEMFSDTVISLTSKGLTPVYCVKSENCATQEDVNAIINAGTQEFNKFMQKGKIYGINNLCEMKHDIFFCFAKGHDKQCCLYNKKTLKSVIGYSIVNDYISKEFPFPVDVHYCNSEFVVTSLQNNSIPNFIKYYVNDGLIDSKIDNYDALLKLNENSNTVLFIQKYK